MHEALGAVAERGIQQSLRADHVRLDERTGVEHRAVDVALGGEVHDRVDAGQHLVELRCVEDVAVHERVARRVGDRLEVGEVARVGEGVVDDDLGTLEPRVRVLQRATNEVRADEAGTAGHENSHGRVFLTGLTRRPLRSADQLSTDPVGAVATSQPGGRAPTARAGPGR